MTPTDPYECERCRWDWRTRRLTLCAEHRRRLGTAPLTGRILDWIPPRATTERTTPPAPRAASAATADTEAAPRRVRRPLDFEGGAAE